MEPGIPSGESIRSQIDELETQVSAQLGEIRERVDELTERAAHFIRTRPGTSLLLAAAAGYLVGRLLRS
jgi:ElaB/YqjD/DUF883 family membrane-anchored ribosome-binding protein